MPMKQALELDRRKIGVIFYPRIEDESTLLNSIDDEITKKYLTEGANNGKIVLKFQKE